MAKRKKKSKAPKPEPKPAEIVTTVFARGKWWHKISPRWVKGYRPVVTYREAQ